MTDQRIHEGPGDQLVPIDYTSSSKQRPPPASNAKEPVLWEWELYIDEAPAQDLVEASTKL